MTHHTGKPQGTGSSESQAGAGSGTRGGRDRGMARMGGGALSPTRTMHPLFRMFDQMNRMMDELIGTPFGARGPGAGQRDPWGDWSGGLEVHDEDRDFVVVAEAPGIDPKDLQLECRDGLLTIKGESEEEGQKDGATYRRSGRFFRQVTLPEGIDLDQAKASCRNGLVVVRFPKVDSGQGVRRIPIGDGEGETRLTSAEKRRQSAA